ncbi:MAG: protoheme IX farnesyltransferase [Robiginitomaculum sp.]|nr:MAG: protoheme IX farnesyltransferase [Robiginitomaculum sp.]
MSGVVNQNANKRAASLSDAALDLSAPINGAVGAGLGLAEPRDFYALMKPRVMSLVVFTAMSGLICARVPMNLFMAIVSIICIAVGAGAAGALNMWYDRDIDAVMSRTKTRPLPAGKMSSPSVLIFGLFMSCFAIFGLVLASNYYAAGLLAFTIFYYMVIYTMWLKRSTPQNIVWGGAAGAFPPMVGWAAAAGGSVADPVSWAMFTQAVPLESVVLFLIIFLWTPPHFWALALYKQIDYDKAGIPMMPNVKGAKSTRLQIFLYALALAAVCGFVQFTNLASPLYLGVASLLNLGFVALAFKVWRSKAGEKPADKDEASLYEVRAGDRAARNLFAYSILYLFALFAILAAAQVLKG